MRTISLSQGVRYAAYVVFGFICLVCLPTLRATPPSVVLDWDASVDPTVAGYNLYYGSASRGYTNVVAAGAATTAAVSNLTVGATYYFAATTYNLAGLESDYSAEVSYTVPAPNAAPTLDPLGNLTINEDAGAQTVNLSGIGSGSPNELQTLTVTASSSNPSLIPNPVVSYSSPKPTGALTFSPVTGAYGSAIVTVIVDDGGAVNNLFSRSFTVTVNSVAILQANAASLQNRSLTISGAVGSTYQIQYCTNLAPGSVWYPLSAYTQTNAVQVIQVNPNQSAIFYRVLQQ